MQPGDRIQSQLGSYAAGLAYEQFDADTVHAAKVRVIDTFGALVGDLRAIPAASHVISRRRCRTRTAPPLSAPTLKRHPT
jgi:2-methylcitrate dehydratase PrpD